jgi:hypothetical protein
LDTAIIVDVVIGSVVAMVLVFGRTVLNVAWTGNSTSKSKKCADSQIGTFAANNVGRVLLGGQNENREGFGARKKSNDFDSLLNKEIFTCEK